jgi:chaperonin GroES
MTIRPFDDRVIIRQTEAPKESEGVLIPDQSQVAPAEGIVVAVGPGVIRGENLQLKAIFNLLKWAITRWFVGLKGLKQSDPFPPMPDFSADYNPMQVKVGDHVTFGLYAGTKIKYKGEQLIMVRQSDVFFVNEEKS